MTQCICKPVSGARTGRLAGLAAMSLLLAPAAAFAEELFCEQRSELGFWLGRAHAIEQPATGGDGRVQLSIDTVTGAFTERRVGARTVVTDTGRYDIVQYESGYGRALLAIAGNTTVHIHFGPTDLIAFLRVERGAVLQIGVCAPDDE